MQNNENSIGKLVRQAETDFTTSGGTLTSKYVTTDLYEDINRIYAYLESKHISGETDSLGRDKPFFNIVLAARNVWYRATDIDRKNINVKPSKRSEVIPAFLATVKLQEWMKKENFGAFLNDWGLDLAGFNSSVVKFVEQDGKLHKMVVPWSRLICDTVNFDANPKIETLEITEAELRQRKGYNKEMVDKLCDALSTRETTDGTKKDTKSNYIKLYEVHGNFPLSYVTGKESDKDTFAQQMHVISFVASKGKGEFDDFTLHSGREEQDPYMLTALLPATDGSVSLNGSVKTLFEAQWMMNHTVKSIKDQLDIASKLVFQTSDNTFIGKNVLSAIESGDILIHAQNEPLTQVNNSSHDVSSQQAFGNMWKALSSEIVGVSESMLGNAAPSGTAWRQVEALLNESHSLFELMTENKGLYIEQMLRRFVIPHIKKQLDNKDEVLATLEAHDIAKIDSIYIPNEAIRKTNKMIKDLVLAGKTNEVTPEMQAMLTEKNQGEIKSDLGSLGNQRPFSPGDVKWSEVFKDLEWNIEVDITGEQTDKQTVLTTLNTALKVLADPNIANNPKAQFVVDKILMATGTISPIEITSLPSPVQPMQPTPTPTVPASIGG